MAVVDELITLIRFDMPDDAKRALNNVNKSVRGITDRFKTLGIVSAATSGVMAAWGINAGNTARNLTRLTDSTGLATDELQALGAMYERVGGSAKNFQEDARKIYGYTSGAQTLGLEKILDLANQLQQLPESQRFSFFQGLGLSEDLFYVLNEPLDKIEEMFSETSSRNVVSKDALDANKQARDDLSKFLGELGVIAQEASTGYSELGSTVLGDLSNFLDKHGDTIVLGLNGIASGAKSVYESLKPFAEAGGSGAKALVESFGGDKETLVQVGAGLGAVGAGLATITAASIPLSLVSGTGKLFRVLMPFGLKGAVIAAGITAIAVGAEKLRQSLNESVDDIKSKMSEIKDISESISSGSEPTPRDQLEKEYNRLGELQEDVKWENYKNAGLNLLAAKPSEAMQWVKNNDWVDQTTGAARTSIAQQLQVDEPITSRYDLEAARLPAVPFSLDRDYYLRDSRVPMDYFDRNYRGGEAGSDQGSQLTIQSMTVEVYTNSPDGYGVGRDAGRGIISEIGEMINPTNGHLGPFQ